MTQRFKDVFNDYISETRENILDDILLWLQRDIEQEGYINEVYNEKRNQFEKIYLKGKYDALDEIREHMRVWDKHNE